MHLSLPDLPDGSLAGKLLYEVLTAKGLTQKSFATSIGRSAKQINEVVTGKAAITPEMALLFEEKLSVAAEVWLVYDMVHRLGLARHART